MAARDFCQECGKKKKVHKQAPEAKTRGYLHARLFLTVKTRKSSFEKELPAFGGVCFRLNLFPPSLLEGRRTFINATLFLP